MFATSLIYLAASLGTVFVLSLMILKIGKMLGDCPETGFRARTASVTVATGYAAIGAGSVLLIGAALPLFQEAGNLVLLPMLGFAALCLGLGFTQAVTTLRHVLAEKTA
ncbi:hypothetical protein [Lentibacter sp. XHP0401]|uniref:hypothetical protein n=1 Tax=Lentibacter sp. XHP0401 TaxID=2984334 RepID=UPI0021E8EE93|nr:hypothetical protein [Lentibacter sp. XHP0401]MCV2892908.1 hypothetical protein [Lentibacter sp. XHP0401]